MNRKLILCTSLLLVVISMVNYVPIQYCNEMGHISLFKCEQCIENTDSDKFSSCCESEEKTDESIKIVQKDECCKEMFFAITVLSFLKNPHILQLKHGSASEYLYKTDAADFQRCYHVSVKRRDFLFGYSNIHLPSLTTNLRI